MGIESTNPYEKAKQDLITAFQSFSMLPPLQQEMLAKELFGAANVAAVVNLYSVGRNITPLICTTAYRDDPI